MKRVLYVGFIGKGNLGDELMWDLFKTLCSSMLPADTILEPYKLGQKLNLGKYDAVVLGGGSVIASSYIDVVYQAVKLKIPVITWGSGIDKISWQKMNALLHKNEDRFQHYLPKDTEEKLKQIISYAKAFGVRGPLTQGILKHLQQSDSIKTFISGDPAMLLEKLPLSSPINGIDLDRIKTPAIAVNWGTDFNRIFGKNESGLLEQLIRALKQLHSEGYHIVLYSVWERDHLTLQNLKDRLTPEIDVSVVWNANQNEMMHILSKCDFSINFKLHANLLSLAAGTPCMALGYRFKIYDFFHSIQLPKWVLSANTKTLDKDILKLHEIQKKHGQKMLDIYQNHRKIYKQHLISIIEQLKSTLTS